MSTLVVYRMRERADPVMLCREGYTVDGVDMKTHLKTVAYKDQIPSFMSTLGSIGKEQGWTIEDIKGRFSNPLLDSVLF